MKEIINNFSEIMKDPQERVEFVGSFLCAIVFMVGVYFSLWIMAG